MSTTYFKVLDVHEYGWYAYAEDDFFILGSDYPHEGGELYRGEFNEDKIPYLNKFKRECPEAYDNAVKYFNSRPKNNIENALMIGSSGTESLDIQAILLIQFILLTELT